MAKKTTVKKHKLDFLLNPWTIISGIIAGIYIGTQNKPLAADLAPFGDIYLALLQMCILPIMITAVVSSLGRLLSSGEASGYIGRLFIVFLGGMFLSGVVGLGVGFFAKPGSNLDKKAQVTLGKKISAEEMYSKPVETSSMDLMDFFRKMVPANVFSAITRGQNLAILFFSILLGISLGLIGSSSSNTALSVVDGLYEAFLKIIGWIMYGLPFGLMSLFADQISNVGADMMFALLKLVIFTYLAAFILIIIYSIILWMRLGGSYFRSFAALRETFMVALGTSSSFAAIPSMIRGLHDELKLDKNTTNLVVPLGTSLNPQGSVAHFAIAAIFIAQLYGAPLEAKGLFIALLGSVLGGMAASGAPGIAALSMIALVLEPLGLPVKVAIILLAAIDPIIDPILTVVSVHANCASTALVAKKHVET